MPASDNPISEQLRQLPPKVRPTVVAARRTVMQIAPRADEIAYRSQPPRSDRTMWKIARYAVGGANVVGIGTYPDHATIYFYRGRELDNSSELLQGGGKQFRFVTLRTPADVERPAVRRLVREAFALGG